MAILKFCILCLFFVLAGCGKTPEEVATEKKIEKSAGVETRVDVQKNEMTITGEREGAGYATSSGEDAEIPKDFPTDMYIYHPSRIMTAMDMPDGGMLVLTTNDDVPAVAEAYKREMIARSWSEQSAVKNGERLMLVYEKKNVSPISQ